MRGKLKIVANTVAVGTPASDGVHWPAYCTKPLNEQPKTL